MNDLPENSYTALTLAGFDPSGGAGVMADARAMTSLGVYPLSAITAITFQSTAGVSAVKPVDPSTVSGQLDTLLGDIRPVASKTGMLPTVEHVEIAADRLQKLGKLVVDPVIRSSSGAALADEAAIKAIINMLLPECELITPNLDEAARISGITIDVPDDVREAAKAIESMGAKAVCITGGHWSEDPFDLMFDGMDFHEIRSSSGKIDLDLHGTGCYFSASVTACFTRGMDTLMAIEKANRHTSTAIKNALQPGSGMAVPWPYNA